MTRRQASVISVESMPVTYSERYTNTFGRSGWRRSVLLYHALSSPLALTFQRKEYLRYTFVVVYIYISVLFQDVSKKKRLEPVIGTRKFPFARGILVGRRSLATKY